MSKPRRSYLTVHGGLDHGNYPGPEVTYAFRPGVSGEVWLRFIDVDPMELNQDIFAISYGGGTCKIENTFERGFNDIYFDIEPDETYFIVFDGSPGPFQAVAECRD